MADVQWAHPFVGRELDADSIVDRYKALNLEQLARRLGAHNKSPVAIVDAAFAASLMSASLPEYAMQALARLMTAFEWAVPPPIAGQPDDAEKALFSTSGLGVVAQYNIGISIVNQTGSWKGTAAYFRPAAEAGICEGAVAMALGAFADGNHKGAETWFRHPSIRLKDNFSLVQSSGSGAYCDVCLRVCERNEVRKCEYI